MSDPDKPLFGLQETVRHVRTGREYVILALPASTRIESIQAPAYLYRARYGSDAFGWVRPQTEMEDGRFVRVPVDPTSWPPLAETDSSGGTPD